MQCPSPLSLQLPESGSKITVPCGKCGACLHNRRSDWSFRLKQELKTAQNGKFLTLTYTDAEIPLSDSGIPTLRKADVTNFIKRLRKANSKLWTHQLRYYSVGEYGTKTGRPHYHIIMFNLHPDLHHRIDDYWPYGFSSVGQVTDASIHYVTKYHVNADKSKQEWIDPETGEIYSREKEYATMSRRPGIGNSYLEKKNGILRMHILMCKTMITSRDYQDTTKRKYLIQSLEKYLA